VLWELETLGISLWAMIDALARVLRCMHVLYWGHLLL